jgi:hypothetical protein
MNHPFFVNTMNRTEFLEIAHYAEQELLLNDAQLTDEYFYQSLPLCLIDSVYSIGVRYGQVQNVVERYCKYFDLRKIREDRKIPPLPNTQESITSFLENIQDVGFEVFASDIFCNKQRTSTTNGILKAEAVLKFATALKSHRVDYLQDVPTVIDTVEFEHEIKQIPGQGSGISLRYFFMLSGSEDLIKPDRMIKRFLESVLQRAVKVEECQHLLNKAVAELNAVYPDITPRLFDSLIWRYQRQRDRRPCRTQGSSHSTSSKLVPCRRVKV